MGPAAADPSLPDGLIQLHSDHASDDAAVGRKIQRPFTIVSLSQIQAPSLYSAVHDKEISGASLSNRSVRSRHLSRKPRNVGPGRSLIEAESDKISVVLVLWFMSEAQRENPVGHLDQARGDASDVQPAVLSPGLSLVVGYSLVEGILASRSHDRDKPASALSLGETNHIGFIETFLRPPWG